MTAQEQPHRTVHRSVVLEAADAAVWAAVQSPATLCHVAAPLLRFPGLAGRTAAWCEGERVVTWLLLGGVLPVSRHHLEVRSIDPERRTIDTHEWGGLVRTWDHTIHIEPMDARRCRYTDRIDIDAGRLTPLVARFAEVFYRHRQRRWRRLARRHLAGR